MELFSYLQQSPRISELDLTVHEQLPQVLVTQVNQRLDLVGGQNCFQGKAVFFQSILQIYIQQTINLQHRYIARQDKASALEDDTIE